MKYVVILLLVSWSHIGLAQAENDTVLIRKTIDAFFDGMRLGDSSMVRKTLHPSIRLLTCTKNKEGDEILYTESASGFLAAVGEPHEDVWNEKLTSFHLRIDQNMGQVWTNYSFYINETFSHCGVNAFELFKDAQGWRIVQIMDTRRRSPCND